MSCPKSILISAYLDGELKDAEKASLEDHLTLCASCDAALNDMRSLRAAFANAERHQAPYGFATRVMARAAELESPSPLSSPLRGVGRVRGWFAPIFIRFAEAAVLLLVIIAGIRAGGVLMNGRTTAAPANIASSLSLDLFEATPPGSLGNAYLAMMEVRNEK